MCRLMTLHLVKALKGYPLYSQNGKGKEAICRAVFAFGAVRCFNQEPLSCMTRCMLVASSCADKKYTLV